MAVSNVKALPLFLASATGISLFLFAIRPRLGQHQLDALRKADHADEVDIRHGKVNPVFDGITSEVASPRRRFLFAGASFSEASGGRNEGVNDPRARA